MSSSDSTQQQSFSGLNQQSSSGLSSKKFSCNICNKLCKSKSGLYYHRNKSHSAEIADANSKAEKVFLFKCDECPKNFNKKNSLMFHKRQQHNLPDAKLVQCVICDEKVSKKTFAEHIQLVHDISFESEDLQFSTFEKFLEWKESVEASTKSKYTAKRGFLTSGTCKVQYYSCHRSGFFCSSGDRKRSLKVQGSNRINGYCPAQIKITKQVDGQCKVNFIKTHVGHTNDIGHLNLTNKERHLLASKIAAKVPFDVILDEVRSSISDDLQRLHLLTKHDLHNISASFNLNSEAVRHQNDAISVEAWINGMKDSENPCVLYYKPQGIIDNNYKQFLKDDFILIIMNEAQSEILKKFGQDCICIDETHGLNSYGFQLITILVIDDMRQGFPCAFLISNRSDETVLKLFFSAILEKSGQISPDIFMSDMAEQFFNAWIAIHGDPKKRLYCTWHVDQAWRRNLKKISNAEKKISVYKMLRTILNETDEMTFERLLKEVENVLLNDVETKDFGQYFKDHYAVNKSLWAFCYRLHSGLNTNMHIERMHRTIKYIYLHGKNVKRLDKSINAIMKFVRDKLVDRLLIINKGKLTRKMKDLRQRHKVSKSMERHIIKTDNGWNINSTDGKEIYFITESSSSCNCPLVCHECKACIHKYSCTCIDSSIRWNMCKHIHYICKWISQNNQEDDAMETDINPVSDILIIEENNHEAEAILKELKSSQSKDAVSQEEKNELIQEQTSIINSISARKQMEAFKRLVAPAKLK